MTNFLRRIVHVLSCPVTNWVSDDMSCDDMSCNDMSCNEMFFDEIPGIYGKEALWEGVVRRCTGKRALCERFKWEQFPCFGCEILESGSENIAI